MANDAPPVPTTPSTNERRFAIVATIVYGLVVAFVAMRHEPYRDEVQAWLLARDSESLSALWANRRYEGAPLLWHLTLFALSRISSSFAVVQALGVAMATAVAWLIARHAPFPRVERVCILAGYYVLFEYAVVVRNYSMGMLLLIAACAAWTAAPRRPIIAVVCALLLAQTSVLGLVLAFALGAAFVVDSIPTDTPLTPVTKKRLLGGGAVLAIGAAIVLWQSVPPADAVYRGAEVTATTWSKWGILARFTRIEFAHLPFPAFYGEVPRWGTTVLPADTSSLNLLIHSLVTAAIVGLALFVASRRRAAALFYVLALGGLYVLFTIGIHAWLRHFGHYWLAWLVCAWFAASRAHPAPATSSHDKWDRIRARARMLLWLPPIGASAILAYGDATSTFSDGRNVARFIDSTAAQAPIVVVHRQQGSAVAGGLHRPVYYADEDGFGTFARWGVRGATHEDIEQRTTAKVAALIAEGHDTVVVVAVIGKAPEVPFLKTLTPVYTSDTLHVMSDEVFRVYFVRGRR